MLISYMIRTNFSGVVPWEDMEKAVRIKHLQSDSVAGWWTIIPKEIILIHKDI